MSDLTLSEERFAELLGRFKRVIERPQPARISEGACLGLEHLRTLVLTEGLTDADAERHLRECAACARRHAQMEAAMPHLPVRALLGAERGLLSSTEARAAERHLTPDGCYWCRERVRSLRAVQDRIAEWREPLPLPHPDALAAGTRGLSAVAASSDAALEAELAEEGPNLVLEVRTRDASLNHALVSYLLYGRQRRGVQEGFTVLRPDVDGWFTGYATFPKGDLYARLSGCCERMVISPVQPTWLGATERVPLLTAVAASRDTTSRQAWSQWLTGAETALHSEAAPEMPPTPRGQLAALLSELRASLEPGEPQRS